MLVNFTQLDHLDTWHDIYSVFLFRLATFVDPFYSNITYTLSNRIFPMRILRVAVSFYILQEHANLRRNPPLHHNQ